METQSKLSQAKLNARRREFGGFLRSRRERLAPADVGLADGFRRRTQGLRREEVALLAGIGTTWYTWLEQGRPVRASAEVLSAIAAALRLDHAEKRHLFVLNGQPLPDPLPAGPEHVEEPLRRMLDSLVGQPAYVLGRRWDVLAWNHAATILFGDYARLQNDERNVMHMLFANKAHRAMLVDWNALAVNVLAMFRADSARYAGDPDFERLIEILSRSSAEFRRWWPKHEVHRSLSSKKRIEHPVAGRMVFEYTSFSITDNADMKLVVYTPLEQEGSAQKLERLLRPVRANRLSKSSPRPVLPPVSPG